MDESEQKKWAPDALQSVPRIVKPEGLKGAVQYIGRLLAGEETAEEARTVDKYGRLLPPQQVRSR